MIIYWATILFLILCHNTFLYQSPTLCRGKAAIQSVCGRALGVKYNCFVFNSRDSRTYLVPGITYPTLCRLPGYSSYMVSYITVILS